MDLSIGHTCNNKIMTRENETDIMTYRNSSTVEVVIVMVLVVVVT